MIGETALSEKYAAYPEYKDSGVEWLGEIPSHWSCIKLKYIADLKGEKIEPNSMLKYVGMENVESWSGAYIAREDVKPEGVSTSFYNGDVLFGKLRPYLAKSWLADFSGVCSSEFLVLRSKKINPKFLNYYLLTEDFIDQVNSSTYGSKMPRASWDFISLMGVPVPPVVDSENIANFLDHETAKIDTLIDKQQQLIQLLKEKRQAVISHAVTKGLNPNAPMRDSGVEWLGEVPEHWVIMQIRHILLDMEQGKSPECESREAEIHEWGVLKTSCVNHAIYNSEANKALPDTVKPFPQYEVKTGDVLMSRASGSRDLIGSVAYVYETRPMILLSDKIFRLHLSSRINRIFFSFLMQSSYMRSNIVRAISGAEGMANNITKTAVMGFNFGLPPEIEQDKIVAIVSNKLNIFDVLITKAQSAIELMQERRTALISAAVTGKIDVRHPASHPTGDLQSPKSTVHGDL